MTNENPAIHYSKLVERLNRFPQGAPPSETLYQILKMLFSEQEAGLVALLPIKPFTARQASRIWKMDLTSTRKVLDELAGRAILVDMEYRGDTLYTLPPPMAGFFEFSMMRLRGDVDQKLLAQLFYQYLTVEEDFMGSLIGRGETQLGRVFVHEPALPHVEVLDYERASEIIRSATCRGISLCYCRHKAKLLDKACKAPLEICMSFNTSAHSLVRAGYARVVDNAEGLDLLQQAYEQNLVQFGENVRQGVNFICNCCGCCCEAMIAGRRFEVRHPIHTSNFIPGVNEGDCNGCGKCVIVCPVEAIGLVSYNDSQRLNRKKARVDDEICLGCGVCTRVCPTHSIQLQSRPQRVITPMNSTHRVVLMAVERGNLQDLIFDNRVLWSHRALASVFGVILKLPPVKKVMASQQVKSRYLEALIRRVSD